MIVLTSPIRGTYEQGEPIVFTSQVDTPYDVLRVEYWIEQIFEIDFNGRTGTSGSFGVTEVLASTGRVRIYADGGTTRTRPPVGRTSHRSMN